MAKVQDEKKGWPKHFKVFDDLLKCRICYDYMQTTVITPCSHNYCSVCIRRYLTYKSECPACHVELSDSCLHPNRLIDDIIQAYGPVKELVLNPVKSSINSVCASGESNDRTNEESCSPQPSSSKIHEVCQPSTNPVIDNIPPGKVPCPVCGVAVKASYINSHLDNCLKSTSSSSALKPNNGTTASKLKPLPKLVYSLLSLPELRKKLKDIGLSTKGDKKALERRHQRFTTFYNAECDSVHPRSTADLIREVECEEAAERRGTTGQSQHLQTQRNLDEASNEKERQRYLHENSNQFKKLVDKAKETKQVLEEDSSSNEVTILENVPKKQKTIIEATLSDDCDDELLLRDSTYLSNEDSSLDTAPEVDENNESNHLNSDTTEPYENFSELPETSSLSSETDNEPVSSSRKLRPRIQK